MQNFLFLHKNKIIIFIFSNIVTLLLIATQYELKSTIDISLLDLLGEGSLAFVFGAWIIVILSSRPRGLVTNTLFAGLLLLYIAALRDLLDEFFRLDHHHLLMNILESMPLLLGVIVLTSGLYLWKREQDYFNASKIKKEKHFRDHDSFDVITGLNNGKYMEDFLEYQFQQPSPSNASIIIFDVFYKDEETDLLMPAQTLKDLVKVIEMSISPEDLICRYSGQRFLIFTHNSDNNSCETKIVEIKNMVENLAYNMNGKTVKFVFKGKFYDIDSLCIEKLHEDQSILRQIIKLHNKSIAKV